MYDLIIIGGGPAGITAAIYAARKKMNFLMLAKEIGGQVTKSSVVENYTGYQQITGEELGKKFDEHLKEFKFAFKKTEVTGVKKKGRGFLVQAGGSIFEGKTVIYATGARPRLLNVPGELEFKNKGVTWCATCDAPLFKGKDVVVVGGGNSGLEAALQLAEIAKKVYLVEVMDKLAGDKVMIDKLKNNPKVEIMTKTGVKEIFGKILVEGVKLDQGGVEKQLKVQGVFINIGYLSNTELVKKLIKLNERNEIIVGPASETSAPGFFAGGDCTNTPYKQIIIAGGEGCKALLSAYKYLSRLK
ncbi:MAG: FAD-dependent oxidoreductase [Parcubacteria group bacterium]|nr:FAD-dependent oxidoreductase [Parcubacteria group bacterium]